jgi:hypothetical protein
LAVGARLCGVSREALRAAAAASRGRNTKGPARAGGGG